MNKHFYRLVFNKVRGLLMVVSELVKNHQGDNRSNTKAKSVKIDSKISATLKRITFMTYVCLGMVSLVDSSYASTIVADTSADKSQRAAVTTTANGITQVNISVASAAGVSHNKFTQFDVSQQGAILNNSSQASKTELAGYIDGNKSLLNSGSAKVILNEVNSRNSSQLNGYIEVAGQKAQVVIANAAGITCDGCGFINANRATLTTGQPIMENGQLKGYLVEKGNISISGQGMDSSKQDYTDIIAKTVTINSGLWANDVSVVTGENNISQDLSKIEKLATENKEKPQFAVDVAALGGMYAGKIQLIGTESGVGVHNAGQLGASAGSIHISVDGKIENLGKINSTDNINITTQTSLDNQGDISTKQGNISITASQDINNQSTITSQGNLALTANAIENQSDIASLSGNANLAAQENLLNSGNIAAKSTLSINTNKTLTNQGSIVSTDTLNINSDQIDNSSNIAATSTLSINTNKTLTNQGSIISTDTLNINSDQTDNTNLINAESLQITSQQLNNLGKGRIYGTDITLQADELNNLAEDGTASTIASRGMLNIATNTINNYGQSLIYSAGDMNIGGTLNDDLTIASSASTINNHSSSIESGANLTINADEINNINDDIKVEIVDKGSETIHEYQMTGDLQRYSADKASFHYDGKVLILCLTNGKCSDNYYEYQFIRTNKESVITKNSPAKIIAADNIKINAKSVLNDNSQILSGKELKMTPDSLKNNEIKLSKFIQDNGVLTIYSKEQREKVNKLDYFHWFAEKYDVSVSTQKIYNPADIIQTISSTSAISEGNSALAQQNTNQPSELSGNNTTISLPVLNSLYQLNPKQDSHYLIETDPTFTNYKTFISSDYMLERLKIEPDNVLKRLGDGYYEQKMVKEQLIEVTGKRYLDGYNDDNTQYQALMTEGAKFAEKYNLNLGVELTAEQMSELTSDIVWFVSQTVELPDGTSQDVLVPHVYIKGNVSIDGSGALISGNTVNINLTGDLENSGKILASSSATIHADTVNNQKGSLISANTIDISSDKDINNNGGSIVADDALTLTAGQNINLISTTNHSENIIDSSSSSYTNIDSISSLVVNNKNAKMVLKAGNNINAVGASLVASGEDSAISLNADTINLTTQQEQSAQSTHFDKDNYVNQKITAETGTNIVSNGSIELNAKSNIDVHGSNLSASDKLALESGGDISISDAKNTVSYDDHFKQTNSTSFFSTQKTMTENKINNILSSQSELNGTLIEIKAGKNLDVISSQVVGSSDVTLDAGENINIVAGEESYQSSNYSETKKSGLLSSGGFGVSYGTEKETDDYTSQQKNYSGSTIGSTGGNVSITSGKDISVAASDIISKNDINITGENVTIESKDVIMKSENKSNYQKTGFTLNLTGTPTDVYNEVNSVFSSSKKINNFASAREAYSSVKSLYDSLLGGMSIGINTKIGTQVIEKKSNQEQHTAMGSSISAGQNITIKATGSDSKESGDITLTGSEIRAGNNTSLEANHDLNVLAAANTQYSDEKNYISTLGIQASADLSGPQFMVNADASIDKKNINNITWSKSIINSGKQLSVKTGNDSNIIGSQLKSESIKFDTKNNLSIQTLQDNQMYDYKKISASTSSTVGINGVGSSLSGSAILENTNEVQVNEQSGVFAGNGGYDITVGNITYLKGAAITSDGADESINKLDTDYIISNGIKNYSNSYLTSVSIPISTSSFKLPSINYKQPTDKKNSTTESRVDNGTLTVRSK